MYESSKIIIHNNIDNIEPVIEYVQSVANSLELNSKEKHRICYALEESLQNSILHDFQSGDIEEIKIEINRIASGLEIVISDHGIPKNPFTKAPQNLDDIASDVSFESIANGNVDQMSAISDFVIHKLLDRYTYTNKGKAGRSVEMVIYASHCRVNYEVSSTEDIPDQEDTFSSIRTPLPEDLTGISRLFYKSYGYSYVNDVVYYPERVARSLENGELISALAISKNEKVIGHIALMQPYADAKITEWGMAISDPEFRGQGIMSRLIKTIMERAMASSYKGIFSHSVTNHEFTQKICKAHGFSDVALLVGYAGSELSFKNITNELSQRESTIISFKPLDLPTKVELYLPVQHQAMIEKLYAGIDVDVIPALCEKTPCLNTYTELSDTIIPSINIAEIILNRVGEKAFEQIQNITKRICIAKVDVIYIFMDLRDYAAVDLVDDLEKIGYLFGGIFPHYHHEHTLVLQYLNNLNFDYELIHSHTLLATELKNYVQALDTNQIKEKE